MTTNTDTTAASGAASQPAALRLADEAAKLAPILGSVVEGGATDGETDIYADDYSPPDGDVYVYRAADLIAEMAEELRQLHALTTAAPAAQEAEPAVLLGFPPRILALIREVASRNPPPGRGPWEDGNGEPLQDDADAALAWIAARPQADAVDLLRKMREWYGVHATLHYSPLLAQVDALLAAAPQAPAAPDMESVLIDGVAYQTPAPVAAELLRLHLEAMQAPAAPATPNCARCQGSGEDPEGYYDQSKGDAGHTHDGPCRDCSGTGEAPAAPTAAAAPLDLRELVKGMSVSVDVSTGDEDAGHRYFGEVTEVQEDPQGRHGLTLLVQDAEPNFAPAPAAGAAPTAAQIARVWRSWPKTAITNVARAIEFVRLCCAAAPAQEAPARTMHITELHGTYGWDGTVRGAWSRSYDAPMPAPDAPDAPRLIGVDMAAGPDATAYWTAEPAPFQQRVQPWLMECFGATIAGDREERNHRFLEEALELVQSCGCGASEAHQLVDYVFGRPVGEPAQEVGGVMTTLAALCLANGLDMHAAGETELARIWTKVEVIRAKQAAKPKHSPLPERTPLTAPAQDGESGVLIDLLRDSLGAIEVSAAVIETGDSERLDSLADRVTRAISQWDARAAARARQEGGAA